MELTHMKSALLLCILLSVTAGYSQAQTATNSPQVANALRGLTAIDARLKVIREAKGKVVEQMKDAMRIQNAKGYADPSYRRRRGTAEQQQIDRLRAIQEVQDNEINKLEVNRLQLETFLKSAGVTNYPGVRPAAAMGRKRR